MWAQEVTSPEIILPLFMGAFSRVSQVCCVVGNRQSLELTVSEHSSLTLHSRRGSLFYVVACGGLCQNIAVQPCPGWLFVLCRCLLCFVSLLDGWWWMFFFATLC